MKNIRQVLNQDIGCLSSEEVIIITENADGEKYILAADSMQTILNDWEGECEYVPENDAPILFAMNRGYIIDAFETFGQMMNAMVEAKKPTVLKVKDVIAQLQKFNPESEIAVYDDDNDQLLIIGCIDEDDADESDPPRVLIFA